MVLLLYIFSFFSSLGMNLAHGSSQAFLQTNLANIGNLKSLNLQWNYVNNLLDPKTICMGLFCNNHLYVNSVIVSEMNNYPET